MNESNIMFVWSILVGIMVILFVFPMIHVEIKLIWNARFKKENKDNK